MTDCSSMHDWGVANSEWFLHLRSALKPYDASPHCLLNAEASCGLWRGHMIGMRTILSIAHACSGHDVIRPRRITSQQDAGCGTHQLHLRLVVCHGVAWALPRCPDWHAPCACRVDVPVVASLGEPAQVTEVAVHKSGPKINACFKYIRVSSINLPET